MIRHFYKKFDFGNWRLLALKINLFCQLMGLILPLISMPLLICIAIMNIHNIPLLISYALFATWIWAIIPAVLYAHRESPLKAAWAFICAVFSLFALSWICVYSWITMNNPQWLTRAPVKKDDKQIEVRNAHGN